VFYAYFDGDDIGPKLELMLLDEKLEEARVYSKRVTSALQSTRCLLESLGEVDVIAAGGDDLLISWEFAAITETDIHSVRSGFFGQCGCTLSVGIADRLSEAANNLRRAKLLGKDCIVSTVLISS
jgi:hypothetical protein